MVVGNARLRGLRQLVLDGLLRSIRLGRGLRFWRRHCGPGRPELLPEFPLRKGTLWESDNTNKSVKVDYLALSEDLTRGYLVELKTDPGSRRDVQDSYLVQATKVGLGPLMDGLLSIARATSSEFVPKYVHLLSRFEALGFVTLPPSLIDLSFPKARRGVTEALRQVRRTDRCDSVALQIVYVQPHADEHRDFGRLRGLRVAYRASR